MTLTIEAPFKPINGPALAAELKAAAGEASEGWSAGAKWLGVLRLHFADDTPQETIDAALQVYADHDPAVLTAEQQAEVAAQTAAVTLRAADFLAVRTAIQNATTLAALRPILLAMLRLIWLVAKAQRLSDAADPEG